MSSGQRPFVLLSAATSLDGYLDDASPSRLLLSNQEDFERVDEVRSRVDAILVGAATVRSDAPRLAVRAPGRRVARVARGAPENPLKLTVTASGRLDPGLGFWRHGGEKIVYTTDAVAGDLRDRLAGLAEVVSLGAEVEFAALLYDLGRRGVGVLMVEGGGEMHTAFLSGGLADELHLAVAPIVIGQRGAPRFLNPAAYPGGLRNRMRLVEMRRLGDMVLLRYCLRRPSTDRRAGSSPCGPDHVCEDDTSER